MFSLLSIIQIWEEPEYERSMIEPQLLHAFSLRSIPAGTKYTDSRSQ